MIYDNVLVSLVYQFDAGGSYKNFDCNCCVPLGKAPGKIGPRSPLHRQADDNEKRKHILIRSSFSSDLAKVMQHYGHLSRQDRTGSWESETISHVTQREV